MKRMIDMMGIRTKNIGILKAFSELIQRVSILTVCCKKNTIKQICTVFSWVIHPCIQSSINSSIHPVSHQFIHPSKHSSTKPPIHLSIHSSIHPSGWMDGGVDGWMDVSPETFLTPFIHPSRHHSDTLHTHTKHQSKCGQYLINRKVPRFKLYTGLLVPPTQGKFPIGSAST